MFYNVFDTVRLLYIYVYQKFTKKDMCEKIFNVNPLRVWNEKRRRNWHCVVFSQQSKFCESTSSKGSRFVLVKFN